MTNDNGASHQHRVAQDETAASLPIDPRGTDHPTGAKQAAENAAEESPS